MFCGETSRKFRGVLGDEGTRTGLGERDLGGDTYCFPRLGTGGACEDGTPVDRFLGRCAELLPAVVCDFRGEDGLNSIAW